VLCRRAAAWCLENNLPEEALEYSIAAGDVETVARLFEQLWGSTYRRGRSALIQRWLQWLAERDAIRARPMVALQAAVTCVLTGKPLQAERWADIVDRSPINREDPLVELSAATVEAFLCRHGVEQMMADASEAIRLSVTANITSPAPLLLRGIASVLSGDQRGGELSFQDAVSVGEAVGSPETSAVALFERWLVAVAGGDWDGAAVLAEQAEATLVQADIEESYATPAVCAMRARTELHRGDVVRARHYVSCAQRLRGLLTFAFPHLSVQVRIELVRAHVALADIAGARTLLGEIDELLRRRPDLGTLVSETETVRAQMGRQRGALVLGSSALTAAEHRLLPMLATHLTFAEIARNTNLSPHTIKAHVVSIYRKLGSTTRSEAVARSRELGLLDG
jgi:LuxR family maltose regulon positive regulatory protein